MSQKRGHIVDAYTHVWESPGQLGKSFEHLQSRAQRLSLSSTPEEGFKLPVATAPRHLEACEHADKAIVLGFKSHYLEAEVPNEYVANYVNEHPEKLVGFATVDPSRPVEALDEIDNAFHSLGLKGIAIAPAAQDFHPTSSNALQIYELVDQMKLPLLIHQGIYFSSQNKLEYARPSLIDEIAREFPNLKIIIAHMGYPWIDETVVLLEKHLNVYSDVSGLLTQSWRAYNALLNASQYGVIDKILFGSGFPFTSVADCIEALYSINQICQGTSLPIIPREQLRGIVERPTLQLLGITPTENSLDSTSNSTSSEQLLGDD